MRGPHRGTWRSASKNWNPRVENGTHASLRPLLFIFVSLNIRRISPQFVTVRGGSRLQKKLLSSNLSGGLSSSSDGKIAKLPFHSELYGSCIPIGISRAFGL
jgi:hypothetical protein